MGSTAYAQSCSAPARDGTGSRPRSMLPTCTLGRMAVIEGMVAVDLDMLLSSLGSSLETKIAGHRAQQQHPRLPGRHDAIGLQGGELTASTFEYIQDGARLRQWMQNEPGWGK